MSELPNNNTTVDANETGDAEHITRYTISQLAREFDLTTRAIRYYEDEGLISPARRGRQRIYSPRDRTHLKLVLRGKRLGFTLSEIREMFDLYDSAPGESAQLRLILGKVFERKILLEQQLEDITLTMRELSEFESQCKRRLAEMES